MGCDSKLEIEFKKSIGMMIGYYMATNMGDFAKMMEVQPQEDKNPLYEKVKRQAKIVGLLGMVHMAMKEDEEGKEDK